MKFSGICKGYNIPEAITRAWYEEDKKTDSWHEAQDILQEMRKDNDEVE